MSQFAVRYWVKRDVRHRPAYSCHVVLDCTSPNLAMTICLIQGRVLHLLMSKFDSCDEGKNNFIFSTLFDALWLVKKLTLLPLPVKCKSKIERKLSPSFPMTAVSFTSPQSVLFSGFLSSYEWAENSRKIISFASKMHRAVKLNISTVFSR